MKAAAALLVAARC